jgi:hypothetical protein
MSRIAIPAQIRFSLFVALISPWFAVHATLPAQAGQAEISGYIKDPKGGVIAGATATLTELRTGQVSVSKSSSEGLYTFPNLKPGSYRLMVETAGFKRFLKKGLKVATGERVLLNVVLPVAEVGENLTVTAVAPVLNTQSGSLGQTIDNRKIVSMPLNGRTRPWSRAAAKDV